MNSGSLKYHSERTRFVFKLYKSSPSSVFLSGLNAVNESIEPGSRHASKPDQCWSLFRVLASFISFIYNWTSTPAVKPGQKISYKCLHDNKTSQAKRSFSIGEKNVFYFCKYNKNVFNHLTFPSAFYQS